MKKKLSRFAICSGLKIQESPPDLPESGADSIYSYENLPSRHWKKYIYASRFVQLVRAKTPKITYYSQHAKCQLMETLHDFEMHFYDGDKIAKTTAGDVTLVESNGNTIMLNKLMGNLNAAVTMMSEHYQQCLQHCQLLENVLANLHTNGDCFPIIVGRRPASASVLDSVRDENTNMMTPKTPNVCCLLNNSSY